ncbi:P-loop containing nucleoside triphosphate hydrolase protein [Bombardia bombarda]|uniref:P-loop containing nucleoside triphosphate hydrolase protein n=1 Tax=Bombardia bombarda TaxID=252184 RepID=A0AA40C8W1_9PEZI|nr:P-loop containing nucleoside triphosphate hydrolase protein [Bombardia bombarda]
MDKRPVESPSPPEQNPDGHSKETTTETSVSLAEESKTSDERAIDNQYEGSGVKPDEEALDSSTQKSDVNPAENSVETVVEKVVETVIEIPEQKLDDQPDKKKAEDQTEESLKESVDEKPAVSVGIKPEETTAEGPEKDSAKNPDENPEDVAESNPDDAPVKTEKPAKKPIDSLLTMEDIIGPEPTDIRSTSTAWKELEKMVGLEDVKKAIGQLLDRAKVNYRREISGKEPLQASLNRVFLGPPGTGKTTVAKLYGQILAEIGLLSTKEVVNTTPSDFIGQWIGESEAKTRQILDSTSGKVLIIDDAHMFYHGSRNGSSHESDIFRLGCIDTLISRIHNKPGEDRCVILIGYPDMMEEMFQKSNPGLLRRFPLEEAFRFQNYDDMRLNEILTYKMEKEDITASKAALDVAAEVLRRARDRPNFGNGGDVDNLLTQAKVRFRERIKAKKAVETALAEGKADDYEEPVSELEREDFDPEWDRGTRASQKCRELFDGLIGFDGIIDKFQGYQRMAANMRLNGKDPKENIPFTYVFKGPPGTGKTHTARIIGQIFYDMGFLSTNEVVECSASHLIGQYLGSTAPKVVNLFDRALGKVLFIDEAYRLGSGTRGAGGNSSFEEEAVGELVDCMTKPRYLRKMIIVLAGYDRDMDALMKANAGLRGRFPTEVVFPPMGANRCRIHLFNLLRKEDIEVWDPVEPSRDDKEKVLRLLDKLGMTAGWSNARDMKTLAGVITAHVYRYEAEGEEVRKGESSDAKFDISTKDLIGFLKDMLRQRIKGGGAR